MERLVIRGGRPLRGSVPISGAKNAALPALCAALLSEEKLFLRHAPRLRDMDTLGTLLTQMGARITRHAPEGDTNNEDWCVQAASPDSAPLQPEAPYELVRTMRAAILVLGPLLARFGHARVSLPGGCAIGSRPVDQHIRGLEAMGAQIHIEHGYIQASVPAGRLQGATITTDMVTVTGTENLMMAACLARGETVLNNAAQEPEVGDLAQLLVKMGARISGIGTACLRITGVDALHGAEHRVIADRIEAGTFLCAVAAAGGSARLLGAQSAHLGAVLAKAQEAGVHCHEHSDGSLLVERNEQQRLKPFTLRTAPYPGFPTDMQAQFLALACLAEGESTITETVFENRFMHVNELLRLGARIEINGNSASVHGALQLTGATVMATDLRASAGLAVAALAAEGETQLRRIYHLDRGYTALERKLSALGAEVRRERE